MSNSVANPNFEDALNQIGEIRNNIIKSFGEEDIMEKAIEVDTFNEKYSVGHEVYSKETLEAFITDVNKAVEEDPDNKESIVKAAQDSLGGLEQVFVKSNDSVKPMWIKKAEGEEEEAAGADEE